ncbi:tRNA wybutosine-synthesizing protein 4 isoform X2 [Ambystoma mexicanum]
MAALGYFQDDFLSSFVTKKSRRAPLINRGYYIRARAVDQCVRDFLLQTQDYNRRQVLSLGAGFDSLYFRLKSDGVLRNAVVCEVDFPEVVRRKAALITSSKELSELVEIPEPARRPPSGLVALHGDDYTLLGVDLSDLTLLDHGLNEAGLDPACPTLLLAEVVLTYMENTRSSAVIRWAADHFQSACFVIYEQIQPEDPFGKVMQKHFCQLNSRLHALTQFPDREAQRRRFLERGWEECFIVDMNEFYYGSINESERRRVDELEPFDEFEEWHLKCSHYFILRASKGSLARTESVYHSAGFAVYGTPEISGTVPAIVCSTDSPSTGLRRFGHCSALVTKEVVLSTGGFGEKCGHHQRLRDINILVRREQEWVTDCQRGSDAQWDGRLFHTMTWLPDPKCALVVGGRMSPMHPCSEILCLTWEDSPDKEACQVGTVATCPEDAPLPRWRHSATEVVFRGDSYIFIHGGRSVLNPALDDWHFLHPKELRWVKIPVEGQIPEGRHSHSACSWDGGALLAGGLGAKGLPLNSVLFLKPTESGFIWQIIETNPLIIPRYSHTAHVHDGRLLLVGGVWIQASSVPGVTVIDLSTGHSSEYEISTTSLEWPLMLHNHSSVLLPDEKSLLVLGGGGNCFSFGTHLNRQPVLLDLVEIL